MSKIQLLLLNIKQRTILLPLKNIHLDTIEENISEDNGWSGTGTAKRDKQIRDGTMNIFTDLCHNGIPMKTTSNLAV